MHEQFQLGRAREQIKNLKSGIYDQAYQELKNNYKYWEDKCLRGEAIIAQMDGIIKNLQTLYTDWKNKYANMAVLTKFALQDFPEKLKEDDLIMFPENTPKRSLTSRTFARRLWHNSSLILRHSVGLKGSLLGLLCNLQLFPIQEVCHFNFPVLVCFLKE